MVKEVMGLKRFYYIAVKGGRSCEGIWRSESIDSARNELQEQGLEEVNLAMLRSDNLDFLDLETQTGESVNY